MSIIRLAVLTGFVVFSVTAFAEKPEWVGKGKPGEEQVESHKKEVGEKNEDAQDEVEKGKGEKRAPGDADKKKEKAPKDKLKDKKDKEKKEKRLEDQKELDKGSEKGQEQRANRKKWWRFWE
ncbi:hypothetical protein [Teredinibacter sp. KSP-S5-2]|uniref:hypothetical protein n=1 Tax=Teredinibacter sp. KSP-S5-2 TaxID=3034506 RepID=UPI00293532E4|nr:hypothetical protein [Teredinibacter sp. KSP-S5-2]WNO08216.1 hypothetical protein P5V12_14680 [Teredinibacter sp. KSP-S5-2]